MPFLTMVPETTQTQLVTSTFLGYNKNLEVGEGNGNGLEFSDMKNLTSDYYPLLANRQKRGISRSLSSPGGLLAKEALAFVDAGKLYYNGLEVTGLTLSSGEKQLVSMGAYLLIWPDKKYVNTKNLTDHGYIDSTFTTSTSITYAVCDSNAANIENISTEQPENPTAGQYWLDSSAYPHSLKMFNGATQSWVTVPTTYVKISATNIGKFFERDDGVTINGITYSGENAGIAEQYANLNGSHILYAKADNYIVITGLIDTGSTQTTGAVTVARTAPEMDFVTEAGNRIWGCKYGFVNGTTVNEIYASALGDFKNWNKFQGISTDSYVASVGTDGPFTGAITHLGYPLLFKENVLHKVYISSSGAHQINDTACRGVQSGCSKSLAIVGERLFYKARAGIMMYDGSLPDLVSDALGGESYSSAAAGAIDDKYYVSMIDGGDSWHLFVLDTAKGLWNREDNTHAMAFTRVGNELYYIDAGTLKLMTVRGSAGDAEGTVDWSATTGLIGYTTVEQKYISRFNVRMQLPVGSEANLLIEYDSDGAWHHEGHMVGTGTRTFMIPVRPRRCDHFRIRIEGRGDVRVYSISKIFEVGSDVI